MEFEGLWYWCRTCEGIAVHFECCGNSSCNAGGCDKCKPHHAIIDRMIEDGTAPTKEQVPNTNEQLREFFANLMRKKGKTEEEIKQYFEHCDEIDRVLFGKQEEE